MAASTSTFYGGVWRPRPVSSSLAITPPEPLLQRATGEGHVIARRDPAAPLERLFHDGCAKIRLPRDAEARGLEAVLLNTAGGLTGGDRLRWRAEARHGASLTVTSQACERIYRSAGGDARVEVQLAAEAGARLEWLPQETILFDGGALARTLEVDLAQDATFLALEAVILGRTASGETVRTGRLHDRWRIRREGRLIFADDLRLSGPLAEIATKAPVLAGARAFAALLLARPDAERRLHAVRAALQGTGGASAFDGKLFCRLAAPDGLTLRRALTATLDALRDGAPLPRVWRM